MQVFSSAAVLDFDYEFLAPRFFDFINGESEEDVHESELWFQTAPSYAPSPIMQRIKAGRSIKMESICDLSEISAQKGQCEGGRSILTKKASSTMKAFSVSNCKGKITPSPKVRLEKNTPKLQTTVSKKQQIGPSSTTTNMTKMGFATPIFTQENQAIKRQKLEEGDSRKILDIKPEILAHKRSAGLMGKALHLCPSTVKKALTDDRKRILNATPFVSMAERVKKFEVNTREMSHDKRKLKLKITRPIGPEFETDQRVRPITVKSSVELEEEMMAQTIKFKARPLNKKILEGSTVPTFQRRPPQTPNFQEFHLQTMLRAKKNAESNAIPSKESSQQNHEWRRAHHKEPKTPILQTALRTRAVVKSSSEIEIEELEKIPKFKARPLNKKIFESKGVLGVFCNTKRHTTVPQEFNFAVDTRIPPPSPNVIDLFDKLSLNSEYREKQVPRNTTPNPFHLYTEERGAEKEMKFIVEGLQKEVQEEKARIPKAYPYPYSTDYPLIPPKPEAKGITKPEPFYLVSLERHEEEIQKEKEERERMEIEAAQKRIFKARPILKWDPIPVQEIVRRPLTDFQEFDLQADQRAVERAEFDKKIKEKEIMNKRYREEKETAKKMEEEKELKQLRRTMVPHATEVPDFNHPFLAHKSKQGTTKARSPNLLALQRQKRRMMRPLPATSSPATNMR